MSKGLAKTVIVSFVIIGVLVCYMGYEVIQSRKPYTSEELGIEVVTSDTDMDNDGIDDYTDMLQGAKAYIATEPHYKSVYYDGGYPDDGNGVCTDVIWNAFMAAGYNLKDMIDADIAENLTEYTDIEEPDTNIDFRRVVNLKVFFDRNATCLTTNLDDVEQWQAGDIVVFDKHIAICSDLRNEMGYPFIIHHDGNGAREANDIEDYEILGHYRWLQ